MKNDNEDDLMASLATYGRVVEELLGEPIRAGTEPVAKRGARRRDRNDVRRWLSAAAALAFIALSVGWLSSQGADDSADLVAVAEPTAEEADMAFVLPDTPAASVSNGQIISAVELSEPVAGGVIGRPSSRGFVDVIRISILPVDSELIDTDQFARVGGTSLLRMETGFGSALWQERGELGVQLSTLNGAIDDEIIDLVTIRPDGGFDFDDSQSYELIDRWVLDPRGLSAGSISFDLEFAGRRYLVEVAGVPVTVGLDIAGRAVPIEIGGQDAWLLEVDKTPYGVAFQVTPNHSVFVSRSEDGEFSAEELVAVASSLEIVEEREWLAEFPDASSRD